MNPRKHPDLARLIERGLVRILGELKPIVCEYRGEQPFPGRRPVRLWTIREPLDLFLPVGSTVTEHTLFKSGYVPVQLPKPSRQPVRESKKLLAKNKSRKGNTQHGQKNTASWNPRRSSSLGRRAPQRGSGDVRRKP
jgi:hypothetical protein